MSGKQEHPAGWEYLEEYHSFIAQTEDNHPRFFTAFQEALQAQREAGEVRQTAVLTEIPSEVEYLERLRTEYDLVLRRILNPRDQMTSTATLIRVVDGATQTDPHPETTCNSCLFWIPTPILPLSCPPTSPDSGVDPNSPTTATFTASPFFQFPETNSFRCPGPSSSTISPRTSPTRRSHTDHHPYSSRKRHIPSLLNLNVAPSDPIDPQTRDFLHTPAGPICWNCGSHDHPYPRCPHPAATFCFGCGKKGYTKARCPSCPQTHHRSH